jgi:hypothetical protein
MELILDIYSEFLAVMGFFGLFWLWLYLFEYFTNTAPFPRLHELIGKIVIGGMFAAMAAAILGLAFLILVYFIRLL